LDHCSSMKETDMGQEAAARHAGAGEGAAACPPARPPEADAGLQVELKSLSQTARVRIDLGDLLRDAQHTDPEAARRQAQAADMPEAGSDFLGFRLLEELGRGAFGRVFLAQQGDLANRLVALKVSANLRGESQTLAQLQHTNIVPVYSVHQTPA